MVCEAAHGKPKDGDGKTVIHIDGDKNNIRPSNLKWEKRTMPKKCIEARKSKLLSREQVLEIVEMLKDPLQRQDQIALKFGIHKITVSLINRGLSYQDITGIDPNREYPKESKIRLMPNGKYAITWRNIREEFNCLSDAMNYLYG